MGNVKTLEKDFRTVIYQNLHNHDYRPLQNKKQYSRKLAYHGLFQIDVELKEISRERTELFLLLFYTSMISCSLISYSFFTFSHFFFYLAEKSSQFYDPFNWKFILLFYTNSYGPTEIHEWFELFINNAMSLTNTCVSIKVIIV